MARMQIATPRLDLRVLPAAVAAVLPGDRATAAHALAATLPAEWPAVAVLDALPMQAAATPEHEPFGMWLMVERETATVVGDIGFLGPPADDGAVEIGYSVNPDRRRRGYAVEAATALVAWVRTQPGVTTVVARCDPANQASIRTLEKVGFQRDGEAEGQLRWRFVG